MAKKKARKNPSKIPDKIAAEIMYKSDMQCCICQKKMDHIHHLNSNKYDHRIDNLACLCFPHHDDATKKGGLSRKLSKGTIIKYREQHYQVIKNKQDQKLNTFDHSIKELTEEKLLTASKNAFIIIELEKIKEEYFDANWKDREEIFSRISKFSRHSNNRLAKEFLDFLITIAAQTRGGMPSSFACLVWDAVLEFCPSLYDTENKEQVVQLAKTCIYIGDNIAYDSFIHLNNLSSAIWGLSIIKYVYRSAKENNIIELKEEVNKIYDQLESTLRRPERKDLGKAQELVKIFRNDLDTWDLTFPILTPALMKQIDIDRKK